MSWLSGPLSAEIFISTGEWGVQMPPLTSENSHFLRSGPQEATLVMWETRTTAVYLKNFHDSSDIFPMGFIYLILVNFVKPMSKKILAASNKPNITFLAASKQLKFFFSWKSFIKHWGLAMGDVRWISWTLLQIPQFKLKFVWSYSKTFNSLRPSVPYIRQ